MNIFFSPNCLLIFCCCCLIFCYSGKIIKVWGKKYYLSSYFILFPENTALFLSHLLHHLQVGVLKSVAATLTWNIDNPELRNKDLIAYRWTLPQSRKRKYTKLYGFLPVWKATLLPFSPCLLFSTFFLGKTCKIQFTYAVIQFAPRLCASRIKL